MKVGVKTFNSEEFLKHFEDKVDFFEIMAVQTNDYSFLKNFSLPMVIHAEHQQFGVNPADSSKKELNLRSINFARKVANIANAKKIIVHPGMIEKGNKNHSIKNAIDFFNEINDDRILIENIPKKQGSDKISLCSNPRETKKFIKKTNTKLCFDVNHALKNFKKLSGNYNFIKKYIQLNPAHYHIGGQRILEKKEHICLEDSELDLKKILSFYPNDAEITLETETDTAKVEKDVEIIRNALKELGK